MEKKSAVIIGAGIVGLAVARALAIKKFNVKVFDRNPQATGASIRNFGMIWPIGQPSGELYKRAMRSREIWKKIASETNMWLEETGSLHLAYNKEEWQVLLELESIFKNEKRDIAIYDKRKIAESFEHINTANLIGGLYSADEMLIDPREALSLSISPCHISSNGHARMSNEFFEKPILNSPYAYPLRHWELDDQGQPTQRIIETRRLVELITPIPKPRKRKSTSEQRSIVFDEGKGLSTEEQQYDPTPIINELRHHVDRWRGLPNPNDWLVTPETARLLQHWRHHKYNDVRPFFCQVEAVEAAIWLSEVAPTIGKTGKKFLDHLANANNDANPELMRLAAKSRARRK